MINSNSSHAKEERNKGNTFDTKSLERISEEDLDINKSTYVEMVCQTVNGIEVLELEDIISQSKIDRKLPSNYAQRIIELENQIEFYQNDINERTVEKLANLYKVLFSNLI